MRPSRGWRFFSSRGGRSSKPSSSASEPAAPPAEANQESVACTVFELGAHERLLDNIIRHLQDYVHRPDVAVLPALIDLHAVEGVNVDAGDHL
jgi:hypothetical protein